MKIWRKLKRFTCISSRARIRSPVHDILVILLALSLCFNVLLYVLQVDHMRLICHPRDTKKTCRTQTCTRGINVKDSIQKGRVIVRTNDGLTVTNKDALLAGKDLDTKVFLTIGLPTTERFGADYLETTLDSLLHNASSFRQNDKNRQTKIVIFLADIKKTARTRRLRQITRKYNSYLEKGKIQVIAMPAKAYPQLRGLPRTLNDTDKRMYWRSKQAIDFSFLMEYCRHFSPYYLQLEDDVIATRDYDIYMKKFIEEKRKIYWFNLDFSNLGFIGKLYRSETLFNQARFFRLFYSELPVDLLLSSYRILLGNDITKITYPRSLFVHVGYQSSSLTR